MLPNSYYLEKYAQMRHKEMVEAARLEWLIREAEGQKPKPWQKLVGRIGDWMIGLGHRLKYTQTLTSKP
jgi:GH24 family phage-related lysozyme (muramidase)